MGIERSNIGLHLPQEWRLADTAPYLCGALLALLVVGPWLASGYIFGTDWPGPRRLDYPDVLSSTFVPRLVLATVAKALTAQLAVKLVILGCLFFAALGAYRALPVGTFWPRAFAAVLYTVNPFLYGRLQYGQLLYVAGYAALPWLAKLLRDLVNDPTPKNSLKTALVVALIGVLDLHLLIPAAVLTASVVLATLFWNRRNAERLVRLGRQLSLTLVVSLVASAYWLMPLAVGRGVDAQIIGRIGEADIAAFSSVPDEKLGLIPNVLGLYGFWAENTGRFTSMKAFVPFWPFILVLILLLGALGVMAVVQRLPEVDFAGGRPWVFALVVAGATAVILDVGVSSQVTKPIVRFLDTIFVPYRGMRDAGKWAELIALVYAQVVPLGAVVLLRWLKERGHQADPPQRGIRGDVVEALAIGLLLAVPLYYGNGLLFGIHGQVQPSAYPSGWYQADALLAADPNPGRSLFLPWHLYLSLDFVRNTNNVVASPAPSFFGVPVVVSQDPEIPGIAPPADAEQVVVSRLVAHGAADDWARELAGRNIKYVLLARETDWTQYLFLSSQPGFALVADYGSISVYRNLQWR